MNTLVLLLTVSCTPAAGPMPVMESPGGSYSCGQDNCCSSCSPCCEKRPRFFKRLRGLFHRKSQCCDCCQESPSAPCNTYGNAVGEPGIIYPSAVNEGPNFPPMPGTSDQKTTPAKPLPRGEAYLYPQPSPAPATQQVFPPEPAAEPSLTFEPNFSLEMRDVQQPMPNGMPPRN